MLSARASISELQAYVAEVEKKRGFNESVVEKCLLLGEEVGELFKAVRAISGLGVDPKSHIGHVGEELADVMFYLLAIANRCGVDLGNAMEKKDERNSSRVWERNS